MPNTPGYRKTSFWQRIALVIFGLFLTLILIETGLRLGGFIILSLQELRNRAALRQKGNYRILCLGESTTQDQYTVFLEEALNQGNTGMKFSVIDKGLSGTNTWTILSKLESYLDTYHPDMVITMMGINDMGTHMPCEPVSDSKAIIFLKSFRIYKLTRLLWLHIVTRLKELGFHDTPQAIEINAENDEGYVDLGRLYRDQGKFSEAEELFNRAIKLNPRDDGAYVDLGRLYRDQGKFSEAEELFNRAIKLNPRNIGAYVDLGWLYRDQGKFSEAEESLKKALELDPKNIATYDELGLLYQSQRKFPEAEELFMKALEISPEDEGRYTRLGALYDGQDKFSEAEKMFKKVIEINPRNSGAYVDLGWLYRDYGKFAEAEELFKKALEISPTYYTAYRVLEELYVEMGKFELARKYAKEARELRPEYQPPITAANYKKLKAILDKRGITYVCVQYPMRNIEPLKKLFQGNDKDIIFVDNEKVFKDEVEKYSPKNYFEDMFAGDFGHCTEKGNRLLAKNIAKVILKEVFGK